MSWCNNGAKDSSWSSIQLLNLYTLNKIITNVSNWIICQDWTLKSRVYTFIQSRRILNSRLEIHKLQIIHLIRELIIFFSIKKLISEVKLYIFSRNFSQIKKNIATPMGVRICLMCAACVKMCETIRNKGPRVRSQNIKAHILASR